MVKILEKSMFAVLMQNDMMRYFREDLHRRLLSGDFKKQVDGIEMLHKVFCCYFTCQSLECRNLLFLTDNLLSGTSYNIKGDYRSNRYSTEVVRFTVL